MKTIVIEKKVPMPKRGSTVYPWEAMEVGDSFTAGVWTVELANKMNSAYHYYAVKLNRKFASRKVGNNLMVWRTS